MVHTSLIIPVYNAEAFLEKTIDSVLAQTDNRLEVVFVDDGSSDRSVEIIKEQIQKHDNFRLIMQEHSFQGTARNRGLEAATGKYICFLDADDTISADMIEICHYFCETENAEMVFFDMDEFTDDGAILYGKYGRDDLVIEEQLWKGTVFFRKYWNSGGVFISAGSYYIRKSFLEENHIQFGEGYLFEDTEWATQLWINVNCARYIHRKLYHYRRRKDSSSQRSNLGETLRGYMKTAFSLSKMHSDICCDENKEFIISNVYIMIRKYITELIKANKEDRELFHTLTKLLGSQTEEILNCIDHNMDYPASVMLRLIYELSTFFPEMGKEINKTLDNMNQYFGFFGSKTVMYGCGKRAEQWQQLIITVYSRKPEWIPMQTSLTGKLFNGMAINSPDDLSIIDPKNIIITSTKNREEIKAIIQNHLIKECNIRELWWVF